jgi:aryl carrier-like protein
MREMLEQLKKRPTFEEQWPDEYAEGIRQGKARVLQLESIRTAPTDMASILAQRPEIKQWWDQIAAVRRYETD